MIQPITVKLKKTSEGLAESFVAPKLAGASAWGSWGVKTVSTLSLPPTPLQARRGSKRSTRQGLCSSQQMTINPQVGGSWKLKFLCPACTQATRDPLQGFTDSTREGEGRMGQRGDIKCKKNFLGWVLKTDCSKLENILGGSTTSRRLQWTPHQWWWWGEQSPTGGFSKTERINLDNYSRHGALWALTTWGLGVAPCTEQSTWLGFEPGSDTCKLPLSPGLLLSLKFCVFAICLCFP